MDHFVRFNAGLVVAMLGFLFLVEPFLFGTPRRLKKSDNYTPADWVATWISLLLFVPICGRVLGWW